MRGDNRHEIAPRRDNLSQTRWARAMHGNDLWRSVPGNEYFRRKTGTIVSSVVAETKGLHAEFVRRRYPASARSLWHVRQPHLVLLWSQSGTKKCHADIDGRSIDANVEDGSD